MKDILVSTGIILAVAMMATCLGHLAGPVSRHVASFASHIGASPVGFLVHGTRQLMGVTWL